jgi:hypothetical protein
MTDHEVTWRIDDGFVCGNLTCNAAEGAPCRRGCLEGCADICDHEKGDVGYCLAVEWIDATGDLSEAHTGKDQPLADGPVHVEWDGDGWLWTYVEGTA